MPKLTGRLTLTPSMLFRIRPRNLALAVCMVVFSTAIVPRLSGQTSPAGVAAQAATANPGALPTVVLSGLEGDQVSITAADIATMPRKTITVFNAHTKVNETYGGVLLSDVLSRIKAPLGDNLHGKALGMYVLASGADHYTVVYSLAELDPHFHSGSVLIADTLDGQVLPVKQGPLQLVNTEDKRPARWVRQLVGIRLVQTE